MQNTSTIWKTRQTAVALATAIMLAACGGGSDGGAPKTQALLAGVTTQQLQASAYVDVVQKIYIAYFGRPADSGGLASFTAQLAQIGAPADIAGLEQAYYSTASVRSLVDSFSASAESATLYPGDTKAFVTAVYDHLLNRVPDAEGLAYWVDAIDHRGLSKSLASLSITVGALANTTDQGKKDAALISLKSAVANSFTTALEGAQGAYVGDNVAALARTMLASLMSSSTQADFQPVLDAVTADLKAGTQSAKPYPLLLSYMSFLSRGQALQSAVVSGTCSGYSNGNTTIPAQVTFEGKPALAATAINTIRLTNCNPPSLKSTTVQYFNANFTPVGSEDPGYEYSVFTTAAQPLPVRVAVGDSGSYGVQTVYANSTKQSVTGRRELSYTIEADAATTANQPSAIFNLKVASYDAGNALAFTRQSRYRIAVDGSVTPVSEDEQYSGASTVHLLSKAQPTALKITDSVIGTGAVAANGKTLTAHYTLWLYDASAAGARGTLVESSVGKTPFSFRLGTGQVIAGFEQGFAGMKAGGKRTLIIPSALGYGNTSSGPIAGGAGLVFDVELVSVN